MMARWTKLLLAIQTLVFAAASLVHAGVLLGGYEHSRAAIAEGVIAAVLLAGLILGISRPRATRAAALAAQGFALPGALVGAFTIAIGVGPQTRADYLLHALLLVLLVSGLAMAWKSKRQV